MKRITIAAALLLAFGLAAGSLWAHHSPTAVFAMDKGTAWKGTLTKVDWVNPHIDVFVDVKQADGTVDNWKFESNPPSWFKHVGITRADIAKAIGQVVTVGGVPARDGTKYGYMFKLTFADGNSLELQLKNEETK